ncbi:MAG: hypothetical protein EXS37_08780 [Opitutus sp.]|nr:hypothetical protein [Opitutus sp.]
MKRSTALLVTALSLSGFIQPAFAAAPTTPARTAALVAAVEAVSPDPLGGRLGLAIASARTATQSPAAKNALTAQVSDAYAAWKNARKS